jgi:hypothetical protein
MWRVLETPEKSNTLFAKKKKEKSNTPTVFAYHIYALDCQHGTMLYSLTIYTHSIAMLADAPSVRHQLVTRSAAAQFHGPIHGGYRHMASAPCIHMAFDPAIKV